MLWPGATVGTNLEGFGMIQFSAIIRGRWVLGFGLSELNLIRLRQNQPIYQNLGALGLPDLDLLIVYGVEIETDQPPGEPYMVDDSPLGPGLVAPLPQEDGDIVIFAGNREGRDFIGFGLTDENLADLRSGTEIIHHLGVCGSPDVDAVLTYGITEDAIQRRLEAESGVIAQHVIDLRTPEQKRNPRGFGKRSTDLN
jgi:hypothetical protein